MILSQFSLAGLRRIAMPLFIASIVMLALLYVPGLGLMKGGARRWLRLGPVIAEPSELVKFALVFFLAKFLSKRQERIREFKHGPLAVFLIVGPITLLILKQPDFGSTVMIALILFAMLWAAGARWQHLAAAGGGALGLLAFQAVAKSYRMKRLTTFLDPWSVARGAGFQLVQSFIALGEGGKWGVGLGAGRQKMFYLPEAHTDFVFAVVGEEFGLIGAAVVISLFLVILFRGMRIAHDEPDPFASLLAVGTDGAALDSSVDQHVGGDWPDPDQGTAAAVPELRRHFDHHRDGGVGRATRARAPAGGAMKVIIAGGGTGGHLFPAVALGEEMMRERPDIEVLFVGTSAGLEAKWLPKSGYRYELFEMHGIRGHSAARAGARVGGIRSRDRTGDVAGQAVSSEHHRERRRICVGVDGRGGAPDSDAAGVDGTEHAAGSRESDAVEIREKDLRRLQ